MKNSKDLLRELARSTKIIGMNKKGFIFELYRTFIIRKIPQPLQSLKLINEILFKNSRSKRIYHFKKLMELRSFHYPLQYLYGSWPFRYLDLILRRPILIPRFQTQYMLDIVEYTINSILKNDKLSVIHNKIYFVEYGCGTGAIGLSLLKQYPHSVGQMIDINSQCISLTKRNLLKNQIDQSRVQLMIADMTNYKSNIQQMKTGIKLLISNPPYLQQSSYEKLQKQVKQYEDKNALVSGQSGLQLVNIILKSWNQQWKNKTHFQQKGIKILLIQYGGQQLLQQFSNFYILKDCYGRRRYIFDLIFEGIDKQTSSSQAKQLMSQILQRYS